MLRPRSSFVFFAYASCALLVSIRELDAQTSTSSTVCKESILGQLRCETETQSQTRTANPWDSLIDAIFPSGAELARRRREARQEILDSQQQVLLDASIRRERLADEAAARRRDAALRLFSPKVTEVILSFADSIGLRGAAFKEAEGAALKIAEDIFEMSPDANQARIQDDLRPLFSMYSRRKNQFFEIWKSWASSNRLTIDSLNELQRLHLIDAVITAQETFLLKPDENQPVPAFSTALIQATEHKRLCNSSKSNSCRALLIETDRVGETITLNGAVVGKSPTTFSVNASDKNTITIGDSEWFHSESLAPPAKIWTALVASTSIKQGPPAPERRELTEQLVAILPRIPSLPPVPPLPRKSGLFASASGSVLLAGASVLVAGDYCRKRATANSPFGGFHGGTYLANGETSSRIQTSCSLGISSIVAAISFLPLKTLTTSRFRTRQKQYDAAVKVRAAAEAKVIETNRLRDHLIDSVMTIRRVTANTRTITRTITVIK